jgi:hypothetical protein
VTSERLAGITEAILRENNLVKVNDHNSPGFRPSIDQARQVAVMSCLGLSPKDIGNVLSIEPDLIKLYYKKELTVSMHIANAVVARQALNMASSGRNPDMTKFWLKTRAKWKETSGIELTGKDGGAVEISSAKDRLAMLLTKRGKSTSNKAD